MKQSERDKYREDGERGNGPRTIYKNKLTYEETNKKKQVRDNQKHGGT